MENLKGNIEEGANKEEMEEKANVYGAVDKGNGERTPGCRQRRWIINGCYWCGEDNCCNPGWLMARCFNCGGWFGVNRG